MKLFLFIDFSLSFGRMEC